MGGAAAPPFVMPGTAPTSAPHRLNAGSPLNQMLTTDAGPSPYLQFQTPAQMSFQQPNGLPNYTAALSGDCGEGLSGDGLHLPGGFAQYPGSRTHPGYVLPYNGLQEAQGYFPPASQQLQQPHLAADSSGNVEHDGAAEVELAQPLPDRHRHNVSDTLQQGLEHTEDMRRQSQARHLGGYNAGSEPYRTSYDPHSSQMYGDDGGGAASDIDTNPSVNGEGQMSTLVQHQVGMSKDSLPAYGSLYGPDGAPLQAHQAFSPPFSPNATGEPELLSPTGPPSQRGPWQSSFAMRAPSFNVEAPAFNPTSMGSALGLGAYPNGNSEEPIFQPPSRRKSIIPIRKPDDASSDEDSDQNGSMRHKKDESHDREHIRDSGVAMNGADGLKYDQLNGVEDPVPADAMQSGAGQQSHDNPNTSTKPPGASTLKPTAKPFEFHPGAPSFHAGPVEPPASSSPAVVVDSSKRDDAGGSTDADDIDAVMRQLNGDSDDLGIERALLAEPVQNGRTNGCSSSLSSSSHGMHGSGSPSPTIKASNGTSSTSLEPTASRFDASRLTPRKAMLPGAVQQIEIDPRNRRVSDYSDIIRDDEVHKLHTRAKYFDTRIHDIVGEILDARLRPLGTTLSTIHEAVHTLSRQGTLSGDRAVVAHARSHSYGIEDSDADDEDDGTTASQRRSLSPISRREARKIEKIKQAMLQALAAHRESQTSGFRPASQDEGRGAQETQAGADLAEVRSALAEIRELTRVRSGMIDVRPEDETAKVSLRQVVDEALAAHAAAQEQSRPSTRDSTQIIEEQLIAQLQSLKEMLRDSEQRADREMAMRKDAQDSLTECQHLLRFAEADSDKQRDLAERYAAELKELKEVRLPEADKIAEQYERLREEQRSTHWTLSELSEKNINLVGRLDETTVTGENLKAQSEKLKSENFELRQTASSLKTQLEERAQARLELRTKYDQLRADMLAASEEVARERAAWKAREEELALGNATMKAMYQQSIKAREQVDAKLHEMESIKAAYEREIRARQKLENDIADLEQQEKESSKFRVMLSQAQRENGQLNEVIIQLRQETQSSQKEISRLAREKDTIQSRCDRLKNEYEDSRENAKAEHERLSRQLHDIKAKAWADTEQLRTVLSETKAKHKDEVEKLEDEVDDLEIRRQEEVERLAAELAEVQKKSRTAIDRLKYELRFISNGKQEELNRLRAELDEVQSARRRDLERRDQQLSALAAKDQAKIDALKHDLNAAESLRRIDIQNMQREMDHLSSLKAQQKMEYDQQAEQLNQLEAELARARTAAETSDTSERSVSLLKAQISELELKHEEELASLRADLQAAKDESEIARARLEVELEQARESQSSALDDAADAHEKDLARERLNHEKTINDLRERHARALHNMTEDKTRHEAHIAEMMQVKEEKISHLQEKNDLLDDKVRHLQEKLDIAKAAAQAAAQAAQNARSSNVPSTAGSTVSLPQLSTAAAAQTLATTSAGSAAGPEKISPQALRESIIVLQDQLQQREQRIEELESKVATLDQDAPHKLKEKDTEIAWLRELLGVRLDDLQDIIATLSLENYDAAAARDAAIRLKANLDMEQQERERAMTGKGSFPSLDSIKDLAVSSKTLPLAAAAAWGSWRRKSSVIPERTESGATTAVSTPSKAAATAQSFLSGLLSPPSTAPRRGRLSPAPTTTASGPASRKSRTDSASTDSSSRVSSLQAKLIAAVANSESESAAGPSSPRIAPVSSTAEEPADARPQTPLFANADYDHDPPSTYFGEELLRLEADMHDESATGEQALLKESVSPLSGPHHDPEHPTALTARDEAFAPLSP
ncbi:hypothetical protein KEM52_005928 [Ascosphaera acerosa]|nr:hypothetical protein KEM52_005928 [Ascosphaera acerosa]